jgi:hypothetical protein
VQEFGNSRVASVGIKKEVMRVKLNSGAAVPTGDVWLALPEENLCVYADEMLVNRRQ